MTRHRIPSTSSGSRASSHTRVFAVGATLLCSLGLAAAAGAQVCADGGAGIINGFDTPLNTPDPGSNCSFPPFCHVPDLAAPLIELRPIGCDPAAGACSVRATTTVEFPGNGSNPLPPPGSRGWATLDWTGPTGGFAGSCGIPGGNLLVDQGNGWIQLSGFTCSGFPLGGTYTLLARTCLTSCTKSSSQPIDLSLPNLQALFCEPAPPVDDCDECTACPIPGSGASGGGGGPRGVTPAKSGPKAELTYHAGGVGHPGFPGTAAWNVELGRYWSHDYAERIVMDPDIDHVWLLTRKGSFREFTNPDGSGVYQDVSPSDEHRTLTVFDDGMGNPTSWELRDLDGTVKSFRADGLWEMTEDRNGNQKVADYTGGPPLQGVIFPDGRSETFSYDVNGRLESITELGVDSGTRTWTYTWTGDDLTRIDRPDGTAWELFYTDSRHPGYLTRQELVNIGGTRRRVEKGWAFDADGNVVQTWKGETVAGTNGDEPGPSAVELYTLSFDDPNLPTETTVTNPLGSVATYTIERDTVSLKPKVTQVTGDCPVCGFGPETEFQYNDAANPLLPTTVIETKGPEGAPITVTTDLQYDANGQVTSKIEAVASSAERETTWQYDTNFEAFPTLIQTESALDELDFRETAMSYDPATGDLDWREIRGLESVGGVPTAFTYRTNFIYNTAGRVTEQDPPGYSTGDVTQWTYDEVDRGGLVPTSRTDPIVGTTSFVYDDFNRLVRTVDPNGLRTDTQYDDLNRVVRVIQRGTPGSATDPPTPDAPPGAGDLATTHEYNAFGDLFHTTLPEGNVIEYLYDYDLESPPPATSLGVGRLQVVERKPDAVTAGERTVTLYDDMGNRIHEELQRADTTLRSATDYTYRTGGCLVEKVIRAPGLAEESVTEYDYDCAGNLIGVWDANHPKLSNPTAPLRYEYDELDRLTRVRQASGGGQPAATACDGLSTTDHVTCYAYDVQDHLVQVEDAERNVTDYVYSDRDLLTDQGSQAAGASTFAYNEHGELVSETDARNITVTRVVDAADRVTSVNYPDNALDTTYSYDSSATCSPPNFPIGRLAAISRPGTTVEYCYDLFGRVTQDGDLAYTWDDNGNRETITYPGGVTATYGYDASDRATSLTVPGQTIVSTAAYEPSGPLASLALGNGITETRGFDQRYVPTGVSTTGNTVRAWTYMTDAVGNLTQIDEGGCVDTITLTNQTLTGTQTFSACTEIQAGPTVDVATPADITFEAGSRITLTAPFSVEAGATFGAAIQPASGSTMATFGYQDHQYFLTSADGPWGTRDWAYDRIGNRTAEQRGATLDTYAYEPNPAAGNSPVLDQIDLGFGSTADYTHGPAGHLELVDRSANVIDFSWDDAGRLASSDRFSQSADFTYDGRGFLAHAEGTLDPATATVDPTYSSDGLLHALTRQESPTAPVETVHLFYLAGRPVAFSSEISSTTAWTFLTTDHLGTPLLATDASGAELWQGGFEPFGADYNGAQASGIFLRFPGQWFDESWQGATEGARVYYNVHRWYEHGTGRYTRVDPLLATQILAGSELPADSPRLLHPFAYADSAPLREFDSLGLESCDGTWRLAGSWPLGELPDPSPRVWSRSGGSQSPKNRANYSPTIRPGGRTPGPSFAPWTCRCAWVCEPCDDVPIIYALAGLPRTKGVWVHTGSNLGGDSCLCYGDRPGPDTGCEDMCFQRLPSLLDPLR